MSYAVQMKQKVKVLEVAKGIEVEQLFQEVNTIVEQTAGTVVQVKPSVVDHTTVKITGVDEFEKAEREHRDACSLCYIFFVFAIMIVALIVVAILVMGVLAKPKTTTSL